MKHVIVIETSERKWNEQQRRIFSHRVELAAEAMAHHLSESEVFIQSRFFVESATAAVHEMYNLPKWEGVVEIDAR